MLSKYTISLLRRWTTTENLTEIIDYTLEQIEPDIDAKIHQKLLKIKDEYNQFVKIPKEAEPVNLMLIRDCDCLVYDYLEILTQYENKINASEKNKSLCIYNGTFKPVKSISTNIKNVPQNNHSLLMTTIALLLFFVYSLSCLVLSYSTNSNYYDANWHKVFMFFVGGVTIYFILKIYSNWILYFPNQYYSHKLDLLDDEGEVVGVLKKDEARKLKKSKDWYEALSFSIIAVVIYFFFKTFSALKIYLQKQYYLYKLGLSNNQSERKEKPYKLKNYKYNWLQVWRLIYPIKKPKWVIYSKLLKWYIPILDGLKTVLLPSILALACLLVFQSYLNISFTDNATASFGELIKQNQKLEVIKDYVRLNALGQSIFTRAYYANGLFVLLLIILSLTGVFLSKIQQFLRRYKLITKTLKFLYFFFIILTTFTYSGSMASNFVGEKKEANDLKIAILKHDFDVLVCEVEEQLLEEQIVESILENEKLEEVLEELEEHEEESEAGEAKIGDVLFEINLLPIASIGAAYYAFKPNYSKKKTIHKLYDIFPDRPKPKQPVDINSPKSTKSSKSSTNQNPYNYQFTSDNSEIIWDEIKNDLTTEKIENIKENFSNRREQWNIKFEGEIKKKPKALQNILGKFGGNRSQQGINIVGKTITKESFTQVLNAISDNEVAKILFRAVYEKAIDPKIEQYIIKQTNAIVKDMPNPPLIKTDVDIDLDKELEIIKELVKNEKIHIEIHYNKQNKALSKLKIKEEVKLEKRRKERERKAKLNPKKSVATEPKTPTRKYALHNGKMLYTTDGLIYYDRSGKPTYVQPNGRAFPLPNGDIPIPLGGISGTGSGRSTRSYGG